MNSSDPKIDADQTAQPAAPRRKRSAAPGRRRNRGLLQVLVVALVATAAFVYFVSYRLQEPRREVIIQGLHSVFVQGDGDPAGSWTEREARHSDPVDSGEAAPAAEPLDPMGRTEPAEPDGARFANREPRTQPSPQLGRPWIVPALNLEMVSIPAGTFIMGSPADEAGRRDNEGPQTRVTLSRPFWLGKKEVTQAQWRALMGTDPSSFWGAKRPVETVSWEDAMEFSRRLTERERREGRLPEGYEYMLPTEAQWEYAARAGTSGPHAGDLNAVAWYDRNSGNATREVGLKRPNPWGLHDMHGNVWEWCLDRFADSYPGGSVTDPQGPPAGNIRVYRGGSWFNSPARCRAAYRNGSAPDNRSNNLGFRLALSWYDPVSSPR